jgi:hypothetical protein
MEQKLKSKIEFKLDSLLLNKYKSFCDKNGKLPC